MQSRIYHYEIDRAVVNAIYAAHNSQDGTPVTLYEWTPPAADRAAAKLRLAEFLPELVDRFGVEAFTADASLYLTTHNLFQAADAIAALQARNLFLGFRVIAPKPQLPAPDPPPVPQKTAAAAAEEKRASTMQFRGPDWSSSVRKSQESAARRYWIAGWVAASLLAAAVVLFLPHGGAGAIWSVASSLWLFANLLGAEEHKLGKRMHGFAEGALKDAYNDSRKAIFICTGCFLVPLIAGGGVALLLSLLPNSK